MDLDGRWASIGIQGIHHRWQHDIFLAALRRRLQMSLPLPFDKILDSGECCFDRGAGTRPMISVFLRLKIMAITADHGHHSIITFSCRDHPGGYPREPGLYHDVFSEKAVLAPALWTLNRDAAVAQSVYCTLTNLRDGSSVAFCIGSSDGLDFNCNSGKY